MTAQRRGAATLFFFSRLKLEKPGRVVVKDRDAIRVGDAVRIRDVPDRVFDPGNGAVGAENDLTHAAFCNKMA